MAELLQFQIDMTPDSVWRLVTVDPAAKAELLHVQEVGDFDANRNYYTTREGLDSFLLKLTVAGKGVLDYEGQSYPLQPRSLFWIDCGSRQHYYTDPQEGRWRVLWVHFSGATAAAYYQAFRTAAQGQAAVRLSREAAAAAEAALTGLLQLYSREDTGYATDIQASAVLTNLLAACIGDLTRKAATAAIPATILDIKDYLTASYADHISLDALSARFSMSKFHLQRSFKRYIGQSPADYLMSVRMTKAKQLLRTSAAPINEVAYAVGFETASHFISAFRSREGLTPQKYRKTWSNV